MMVVNASNREKDFAHISRYTARFEVTLEDISDDIALLALQGPDAAEDPVRPHRRRSSPTSSTTTSTRARSPGMPSIISRTGYTGEDGFELYFRPEYAGADVGRAHREHRRHARADSARATTLRLEMGMALYGNDIDDTTTPLEANLGWLVKLKKGDFVGREALVAQKERGLERKLVGLRRARQGVPAPRLPGVLPTGSAAAGSSAAGPMSPTLGIPIGTCYLPAGGRGRRHRVRDRDPRQARAGEVVKMPFYERKQRYAGAEGTRSSA